MRLIKGNVERIAEDPAIIASLKDKGYKPLEAADAEKEADDAETVSASDLSAMKVEELRKLAAEKGIDGVGSLSKKELLEALKDVV